MLVILIFFYILVLYIVLYHIKSTKLEIEKKEIVDFFNRLSLGISKEEVDGLMGEKGEWVCTHYEPWLSRNSTIFQTFFWETDFILICVFRDGKLVRKKIKHKNFLDIVY